MKFNKHYKERIASFLTAFELNPSSISQKWIENKFYSMDEERMTYNRIRSFRESARFTTSNPRQNNMQNSKTRPPHKKIIRCKYCYRSGHFDSKCPDKANKRPPSMPEWISKATCLRCKKKGHLAFNCPPKYNCKIIKANSKNHNDGNRINANNVKDCADEPAKLTEFAGMATTNKLYKIRRPNLHTHSRNFQQHRYRINNLCNDTSFHKQREKFNDLLFTKSRCFGLQNLLTKEIHKLPNYDKISILWLLCAMNKQRNKQKFHRNKRFHRNPKDQRKRNDLYTITTPPHSNKTKRYGKSEAKKSTNAFNVEHELLAKNHFPASDLERGWVIDSGASAHMTPFRRDCKEIQQAHRKIFLADGSTVICKEMGKIDIPIIHNKREIGILRLDNVLIVPNLDRRLFSVNSFLTSGNSWVHFENNYIHLGIKDGPKIKISLSSLQSNALIVRNKNKNNEKNNTTEHSKKN